MISRFDSLQAHRNHCGISRRQPTDHGGSCPLPPPKHSESSVMAAIQALRAELRQDYECLERKFDEMRVETISTLQNRLTALEQQRISDVGRIAKLENALTWVLCIGATGLFCTAGVALIWAIRNGAIV